MDKLMSTLSLCRKAGALAQGFEAVRDVVFNHDAFIVLIATDLSEGSQKRVGYFCEGITEVYTLPYLKEELLPISRKTTGVFAVRDENLAKLCLKHLQNTI